MAAQRLYGLIVARQFRFGQCRMNFAVTDMMEQNSRAAFATFQLRDKVVLALFDFRRDRTAAKGADRIRHFPCHNAIAQATS